MGKAFATASLVCDDDIEGSIADLNCFINTRTNNVWESLVDKQALDTIDSRSHPEDTWRWSRASSPSASFFSRASRTYRRRRGRTWPRLLTVLARNLTWLSGGECSSFQTHSRICLCCSRRLTPFWTPHGLKKALFEPSCDENLELSLHAAQHRLAVCHCGELPRRAPSAVSRTAMGQMREDSANDEGNKERSPQEADDGPQEAGAGSGARVKGYSRALTET